MNRKFVIFLVALLIIGAGAAVVMAGSGNITIQDLGKKTIPGKHIDPVVSQPNVTTVNEGKVTLENPKEKARLEPVKTEIRRSSGVFK